MGLAGASATGASDVNNLAYAVRLGLWGPGTAFANREQFISEIRDGGIAAMELVARDPRRANLVARLRGTGDGPSLAFVGHTDVVPVEGQAWSRDPFTLHVEAGRAYGRGAVDMKGAIAAMVAAVAEVPQSAGTISFIITGDEEGPAKYGTLALIDHMRAIGELYACGQPRSGIPAS